MVAWCVACPCVRRSCGLQQAVGKGLDFMRCLLGFDHTVHQDAAANAVTIALRHDTCGCRRLGDRELERPRQLRPFDVLRVTIAVEIADLCDDPWRSENLVRHMLWVERFGVVDSGVGIGAAFLRAEYTV